MSSIDSEASYYDLLWRDFRYANRLMMLRCAGILEAVAELRVKEPRILDLGCGAGWLTSVLSQFGPTLGVDLSEASIQAAQKRFPYARFIRGDLSTWCAPEDSFDVVVSHEVIEHLADQAQHVRLASSALSHGGTLILTTPHIKTFAAIRGASRETWSNQPIENWLSPQDLRRLLGTAFDEVRISTVVLGFGNTGSYRLANARRLKAALDRIGAGGLFDALRRRMGYGLHLIATAKRLR